VRVCFRRNVFTEPLLTNGCLLIRLLHSKGCTRLFVSKALPSNVSMSHNMLNITPTFFVTRLQYVFPVVYGWLDLSCDNTGHIFSFICCNNSSDWSGSLWFSYISYLSSVQTWWSNGISSGEFGELSVDLINSTTSPYGTFKSDLFYLCVHQSGYF
jgi:hypothetical protein